jgi:hypothetical protein
LTALNDCWAQGVYLPALMHRFYKLSLQVQTNLPCTPFLIAHKLTIVSQPVQLLARYSVWVQQVRKDAALLEVKQSTAPDSGTAAAAAAGAMSALGTPAARVTPAVAPAPADHKSLLQPEELLYLYYDVEKLIATVRHCIMRYLV